MSQAPAPSSSRDPYGAASDPVVAIIESTGHEAGPRVLDCARLAAAAHVQRAVDGKADGPALNRSTLLWALGRMDESVRTALEQNHIRMEALQSLLGIRDDPAPLTGGYEIAEELARAVRTLVETPSKLRLVITPRTLAAAVLEDVVTNGGLLGARLGRLGTTAEAVLATLRSLPFEGSGGDVALEGEGGIEAEGETDDLLLPRMRDVTPQRFGVQLPPGTEDPGPYVPRDVDGELGTQLRERRAVVTVEAPVASGAIRTVYESLRRERPDDRVLILHEWLAARADAATVEDLDLYGLLPVAADVVWVRNLGELVRAHPVVEDWFRDRGVLVAATLLLIVRPQDREMIDRLGLPIDRRLELTDALSTDERQRARTLYEGEVTAAPALATAAVRRQVAVRATYAADSAAAGLLDRDTDDLGVRADVDMLAKLIASKDVRPPLSIGLFGPWGSGKSFLMGQVQLRIQDLAKRSQDLTAATRADANANANANADTNADVDTDTNADVDTETNPKPETKAVAPTSGYLTEVIPVEFNAWQYAHGTALWAALINKVFEQVRVELTKKNRYEEVMQQLADKDLAVVKARVRLDAAKRKVTTALPAAQDRPIEEVVKKHKDITATEAKQVELGLQVTVATSQMSELKDEYDRLKPLAAQVAQGWSAASRARRAFVVACLVAVGGLGLLVALRPDWMAALLGAVVAILGAVLPVLGPVRQGLEQARKILRADARDKDELRRAEVDLARATEEMTAAKLSGLAGLYGFVDDRSRAAEYLQPLGMAPMIRDDLERLAELARGKDGIPGIDRIVIYIDDLDRCPASQVVQVLEAVNLLFGFELFVVIVAVDSRWLLRSLDTEFSEAFDKNDSTAPTPQNYLEKIIQIPFWVQPMRPKGFERLVTSLAGEVTPSSPTSTSRSTAGSATDSGDGHGATPSTPATPAQGGVGHDGPVGEPATGTRSDPPPTTTGAGTPAGEGDTTTERAEDNPQDDLNPEALRLTSDERDCMTLFLPLVGTPRAAKRFINTYQLLRVGVVDVDAFLAAKEYEPVLLLLALVTGTVPISDPMIAELATMTEQDFNAFLAESVKRDAAADPPKRAWRCVADACAELPTRTLRPELIRTWLPKVARYSFHHVEW